MQSICGRYTLTIDKRSIEKYFGAKFYIAQASYDWTPTLNAAPSQMLPIIRTYATDRIELARWGFWPEEWKTPVNFAILTTKAKEAVSHIHDRMPVILPLAREKEWLPPYLTGEFFIPPISTELLMSYPVTPKMNRATFNEPTAIAPLEPVIP